MAEAPRRMRVGDPERPDLGGKPKAIRCESCGDVIGVYEPLVHLSGDIVTHTSRAADPGIFAAAGRCYHLACYEALDGRPEAASD